MFTANAIVSNLHFVPENSISGTSTLNAKKHRQRNYRQSSMPKLGLQDDYGKILDGVSIVLSLKQHRSQVVN